VVPDAGDEVRVGPLTVRILWPPRDAPPAGDPNDRTIVAQARAYGHSILLTADSESPVLSRLELPAVDLVKVPHHGSADPGLPDVLSRLAPRVAVIPVGRGNGYGHPAASTLAALRAVPLVLRTDRDGTVRVEVGTQGIRVWRAG
jgi:competence protein ComEC